MKTYSRMTCPYCQRQISASGGGVHHYRKHVREGILFEYRDETLKYGKTRFARIEEKEKMKSWEWVTIVRKE